MSLKVLLLDFDGTLTYGDTVIWDKPVSLVSRDRLVSSQGEFFDLKKGTRELLSFARKKNIKMGILSYNVDAPGLGVRRALSLWNITGFFEPFLINLTGLCSKRDALANVMRLFPDISPGEVLFVDDREEHLFDVRDLGVKTYKIGQGEDMFGVLGLL